jgi:hypothetical protein
MRKFCLFVMMLTMPIGGLVYINHAQEQSMLSLNFNETVTGTLEDLGDTITYSMEASLSQDIVLFYESELAVWDRFTATSRISNSTPPIEIETVRYFV